MTAERAREEVLNDVGAMPADVEYGFHRPVHSLLVPTWGWVAPDAAQMRRWQELLSKPVATDANGASRPKSYRDILEELREATGLYVMPVKRFDPVATEQAVIDSARAIVKDGLAEFYADGFVFDPIVVGIDTNYDGDEQLNIRIVFEGDHEKLTFRRNMDLFRQLRPQFAEIGFPGIPFWSFVKKSEWEASRSKRNGPARTD